MAWLFAAGLFAVLVAIYACLSASASEARHESVGQNSSDRSAMKPPTKGRRA